MASIPKFNPSLKLITYHVNIIVELALRCFV
jgi:hypothetical protein